MNPILVLVLIFVGIIGFFAVVAVVMERLSHPKTNERWQGAAKGQAGEQKELPKLPRHRSRSSQEPLANRLIKPLAALWRLGDTSQSRVQELLVHAGVREKGAVDIFLGAKLALAMALPAATIAVLLWRARTTGVAVVPRSMFMYGAMALVVGLILPNTWLRSKAKKRIERVRFSLPDALDLLIVCVESGLGLDAALVRISQEMADVAPEFSEEISLMNLEISAGKPRQECLRNLALRTGCEEVEALTARINQAARFGTNLGHSLRIHAESLRQKRRQEAEERAAKTTVKLLFPLVFFIFPAIFVVILGAAVVKVAGMGLFG